MSEQLAIMTDVGFGMRDTYAPVLWFIAHLDESSVSLQCLFWAEAEKVIKETGVYDVHDLEGRACWVDTSTPGMSKFLRVADIKGAKKR